MMRQDLYIKNNPAYDGPFELENGDFKFINKQDKCEIYYNDSGFLHRDDGPAIFYPNKDDFVYYVNGKRHRTDGPARKAGQITEYYIDGKLHNEIGPARIFKFGDDIRREYYLNHKLMSFEEWFDSLTPEQKKEALYHLADHGE